MRAPADQIPSGIASERRQRIDVAALGDSFTDAMTLPIDAAWPTRLERPTARGAELWHRRLRTAAGAARDVRRRRERPGGESHLNARGQAIAADTLASYLALHAAVSR